jgi:hypothetical protein
MLDIEWMEAIAEYEAHIDATKDAPYSDYSEAVCRSLFQAVLDIEKLIFFSGPTALILRVALAQARRAAQVNHDLGEGWDMVQRALDSLTDAAPVPCPPFDICGGYQRPVPGGGNGVDVVARSSSRLRSQ